MVSSPLPAFTHRRVLLVFAHADDESAGLGGCLHRLGETWFVCVTSSSPPDLTAARRAGCATREAYAHLRERELRRAVALAGHDEARLVLLGHGDQEATFHLVEMAGALDALLGGLRPAVVITHPYEGGHPDHDATAFAVHCAVARRRRRGDFAPAVVEMTSYHWRDGAMVWSEFLPHPGGFSVTLSLDADDRERKRRLLDCHASQASMLAAVPLVHERLRTAPDYDFTRAPHAGPLFYEHFSWGTTAAAWREHAAEALERLDLAEERPVCG